MISTWSSGTGGAGVIGAVSYAGLTYWLSTENTILLMLIVPIIQAIAFWMILVHPKDNILELKTKDGGINGGEIEMQEERSKNAVNNLPDKGFKDKLTLIPGLLKYMIPIGLVYLFEYFINQGLVIEQMNVFIIFFFQKKKIDLLLYNKTMKIFFYLFYTVRVN